MMKLYAARPKKTAPLWVLLWTAMLLGGCQAAGGGSVAVGPQVSSQQGTAKRAAANSALRKIHVVVPVFNPNVNTSPNAPDEKNVYAELRYAEANRFALKMRSALEDEKVFGRVRVVPNATAVGDLYVNGRILKSNGEDVKIAITVADISGRKLFTKTFKHRVRSRFFNNIRNKGKDAYDPLFAEVAQYIVAHLQRRKSEDFDHWRRVADIRFGASLSEESFAQYLRQRGGRVRLVAAPADDDPMLRRIQPIRVRNQLFIDEMQYHYTAFDSKLQKSYLVWQQQSMFEAKAHREAKAKAIAQGIVGGLLLIAGAAVALEGSDDPHNKSTSAVVGGTAAAIAGATLLGSSFQNSSTMKVHRDALAELGQSLDIQIAPQVVAYQNQTSQLTGNAAEQHQQWIAHLQKIYQLEATPEHAL